MRGAIRVLTTTTLRGCNWSVTDHDECIASGRAKNFKAARAEGKIHAEQYRELIRNIKTRDEHRVGSGSLGIGISNDQQFRNN
jgi:hypothetical protein